MRIFYNLSIQWKQMIIIMLTTAVALLLACAIFIAYDVVSFRKGLVKKISVLADAVGSTCSGAIEYNDPQVAQETLAALNAEPRIVAAGIYTSQGEVFAAYRRPASLRSEAATNNVVAPNPDAAGTNTVAFTLPALQVTNGEWRVMNGQPAAPGGRSSGAGYDVLTVDSLGAYEFKGDYLYLFHPIIMKGGNSGTIFVASDLNELRERLARYPGVAGGMFAAALLVAFILSTGLQRLISRPILQLAQMTRSVALDKNYSVRATKQSDDEVGQLIDGFNEMLTQIQERDSALQAAHDNLERRVEERTEELRQSQALYHSLVEHLPVHVYRKDKEGRFEFVNSRFCQFVGMTEEQILGRTIFDITPGRDLAERYDREDQTVMEAGVTLEEEQEHRDARGSVRCLQVIKSPVFSSDGDVLGTQAMAFDITERKQAEAKLETAHRDLVQASRQAGMAEVATSVLHNVGNVLNSVNISAGVVCDRIKKSKSASISRIADMMRAHATDLGEFMVHDPKGRQLPEYIAQLGGYLTNEQASLLAEIESLRKHIDHIKDIVAMQQSYAKVSGVTETIKPTDLVEDALRMNAGALVRHDVQLIREYSPAIPEITVEKHKVLQILVNLIRNAKYACDESKNRDKQLTVRVNSANGCVSIAIIDNGAGISPENISKIFTHGFTTRKVGHGFGLHSGALAAKELGGSLTVFSEGLGKGAMFTLELPLKPKKLTQN